MRACKACIFPLRPKDDDGTGRHRKCPTSIGREGYLRWKAEKMPGLVALQKRLARGGSFTDRDEDEDDSSNS